MPKGLVAIPAYNEEESLGTTLDAVANVWPREHTLVVDDGSKDGTSEVAASRGVQSLQHPTNLGYSLALQTATKFAQQKGYDYLLFMDADGQHDPVYLEPLATYLLEHDLDLVIGSRFGSGIPKDVSWPRRVMMQILAVMTSAALRQRFTDTTSGFKAVRNTIFGEMQAAHIVDFHSEFLVYLKMRGYKLGEIGVAMHPRHSGQSMHNWMSLLSLPPRTLVGLVMGALEAMAANRQRHP
ncbi:MAG: glycosyltransferase family 2 protein [Chloroflexi bacterium]|nr:glycosyltransferase family 2 protein [Chloroflexota bacterium]